MDDNWNWWENDDEEPYDGGADDPYGDLSDNVRDILQDLGILSYEEVILNFADVEPSELRGDRFTTLEDAILFLNNIGVLSFSGVVYYEIDDLYGVAIPKDTP